MYRFPWYLTLDSTNHALSNPGLSVNRLLKVVFFFCSVFFFPLFISDTDDCYPYLCLNNGTCIDHVNNYTCACPPGFEGRNCGISKLFYYDI